VATISSQSWWGKRACRGIGSLTFVPRPLSCRSSAYDLRRTSSWCEKASRSPG
jgi:hypothetical protein